MGARAKDPTVGVLLRPPPGAWPARSTRGESGSRRAEDARRRDGQSPWEDSLDGPIRATSEAHRMARVLAALEGAGPPLDLLECGCGPCPELRLLPLCARYTGSDSSPSNLAVARSKLTAQGVPVRLLEADMWHLPFADGTFDAVYSAHSLDRIAGSSRRAEALAELARVVRRGGVMVLIVPNARPLLFPARLVRNIAADTPLVRTLSEQVRRSSPPPVAARPTRWLRRELSRYGDVRIRGYIVPSEWLDRHVDEHTVLGRVLRRSIAWLEDDHPKASWRLGCFVQITVRRA